MSHPLKITRTDHFNLCQTLDAQLSQFDGTTLCSLPGFEILLPGDLLSEVKSRGVSKRPDPTKLLIFNGSEVHSEKYDNATGTVQSLVISSSFINPILQSLDLNVDEIIFKDFELNKKSELTAKVSSFWKMLRSQGESHGDLSAFSVDCLLTEMVMAILTQFPNTGSEKIQQRSHFGSFPHHIVKAKALFRDHIIDQDFDLDDLSQECGLSKFHLIRLFKKETGVSPAKYLNQIRIDLSKQLLRTTQKSVIEISQDSGFRDLSAFNKAFKKLTGQSPTSYRLSQVS